MTNFNDFEQNASLFWSVVKSSISNYFKYRLIKNRKSFPVYKSH